MSSIRRTRKGFALVEVLLVVGILSIVGGISVPLYREFQIRNDLNLAMEQTVQGLRRAQILSQSAENDSEWGFFVPAGTLYKGKTYTSRDTAFDEVYPMPSSIGTTGLLEVSYSKTGGRASNTGTITLHATNDESRSIIVDVISEGVVTTLNDKFLICHYPSQNPNTLSIPDSAWPAHHAHGDTLGACPGDPDPEPESSSSSSAASSSSSSSSGGGGSSCEDMFSVSANNTITTTGLVNMAIEVLGSQITYGAGGPEVNVYVSYSKNGGSSYTSLWSGQDVDGGETATISALPSGTQIALKARGYYKKRGWLTFDRTYTTIDGTTHLRPLRDGDSVPDYPAFDNQSGLADFLDDIIDAENKIDIGQYDVVILGELGVSNLNQPSAAADFQDVVLLLRFSLQPGSCT